ncbi:MAG TPA: hypothetical protein VIH18_01400 [Candidatus Binatia bacterium]|jgi:hypothetical protein
MHKFYTLAGGVGSGLSSAVIIPIVMLIAVVSGVAALVLGIGHWKSRRGYINRIINNGHSSKNRDSGVVVTSPNRSS